MNLFVICLCQVSKASFCFLWVHFLYYVCFYELPSLVLSLKGRSTLCPINFYIWNEVGVKTFLCDYKLFKRCKEGFIFHVESACLKIK